MRVPGWYEGKTICAPMVRVSTLAFRLMAAKYGADVVFSEELIAQKLVKTERRVDEERGVVEYVLTEQSGKLKKRKLSQTLVFSTLMRKERADKPENGATVVVQLGANDPDVALAAAKHVENDVDGIDLNMGCPKAFSIKGGMGAALLIEPEKVKAILSKLSANLSIPVTCKIRLLEDKASMMELLKAVASTGISALTIHARFREQRSSEPPKMEYFKEIIQELGEYPVPIVFNGDVWGVKEACAAKGLEKISGAMVARGALFNPTCFAESPMDKIEAHSELLLGHLKYGGGMREAKYTLTRAFQERKEYKPQYDKMQHGKTLIDMWAALGNDPESEPFKSLLAQHVEPMQLIDGVMEEYVTERKRKEVVHDDDGENAPDAKKQKTG